MDSARKALPDDIELTVARALDEDRGEGDITAELIPADTSAIAHITCREEAIFCGSAWATEVFRQLDETIELQWKVQEGEHLLPNQSVAILRGRARPLLTGERTALNFLQTLSGTATISHHYAQLVAHTAVRLLDTRKTIPGLRSAQKYAVTVGGCFNHRMGLYDAFLIKENHIHACGSISAAIAAARRIHPGKKVEVEVENPGQLQEAIEAQADIIMLDNFDLKALAEAVKLNKGRARLEASGGVTRSTLAAIAETGVDFISVGALTKDCQAIDLSMRFE